MLVSPPPQAPDSPRVLECPDLYLSAPALPPSPHPHAPPGAGGERRVCLRISSGPLAPQRFSPAPQSTLGSLEHPGREFSQGPFPNLRVRIQSPGPVAAPLQRGAGLFSLTRITRWTGSLGR
jgi:hypothetical protein